SSAPGSSWLISLHGTVIVSAGRASSSSCDTVIVAAARATIGRRATREAAKMGVNGFMVLDGKLGSRRDRRRTEQRQLAAAPKRTGGGSSKGYRASQPPSTVRMWPWT